MKLLSTLCLGMLLMLLFACKKENIQSSQDTAPSKQKPKLGEADQLRLPSGGQFIKLRFENGKSIQFYKVDTNYFLESDMIFVPAQLEVFKQMNNPAARTYITDAVKNWPSGVIPYAFDASLTATSQSSILWAMSDWEFACPGLNFVARTTESNYIEFKSHTENNSPVGMIGGKQNVNLVQTSGDVGIRSSRHEIGHALGMYHEQSRTDRGDFINIDWANIKPDHVHDFKTYAERGLGGAQFGTFDFTSIMLYESVISDSAFVYNTTNPTMTTLTGGTWGASWFLSTGDEETAAILYGPPFAKFKYTQTYYNFSGGLFDEWEVEDGDISVHFFSDPACTIPFTLTETKRISYYAASIYPNQPGTIQYVTLAAGQNSYTIGYQHREYRSEYGNVIFYQVTGSISPGYDGFYRGWF